MIQNRKSISETEFQENISAAQFLGKREIESEITAFILWVIIY